MKLTDSAILRELPDLDLTPHARQKYAIPTRLAERTADLKDEKAAEKAWRKAVIARDGRICRCCKRTVIQQLALAPERLEVHHIAGRADQAVRWDVRNGMVCCARDHEQLQHYKILILQAAKHRFKVGATSYTNASKPLIFKRAIT